MAKNDRKEHDRKARSYEETTTGNPYHLSKGMRNAAAILVVILVIGVTSLFVTGILRF